MLKVLKIWYLAIKRVQCKPYPHINAIQNSNNCIESNNSHNPLYPLLFQRGKHGSLTTAQNTKIILSVHQLE